MAGLAAIRAELERPTPEEAPSSWVNPDAARLARRAAGRSPNGAFMTGRSLPSFVLVISAWAILFQSLACSTTQTMSRPLSATGRAKLTALQSNDWVIRYRATPTRAVSEPPRVEGIASGGEAAADQFPPEEAASKPLLYGELLHFTSERGRPREVPIDAVGSIQVDIDHVGGAFDGAGLGLLAGVGVGAVLGFALGSDRPLAPGSDCGPCSFTAGQKAVFLGIAGGVVGVGVGLLVGAIVGHRHVVEFEEPGR